MQVCNAQTIPELQSNKHRTNEGNNYKTPVLIKLITMTSNMWQETKQKTGTNEYKLKVHENRN